MKKLFGVPHASWLYSLIISLVVISLLFSPLAGLGSRAHAQDEGSIVPQIVTDLGNLTEITQIIPNVPPVISGVQVTNITTTWATIVWTTDKPADTVVNYGTSTGLGLTISDAGLTTDHSILLNGLEPGVTYYYEVQSTDYSSNTVTDNNGGIYYSFTTSLSDTTGKAPAVEPQPSEPQKVEPIKTTAVVSPDKDVELKSPSEKITLDIPAGAASENLRVDFTELTPWGSTGMKIVNLFDLNAYAVDRADAVVSKFDKELQITIKHSKGDLGGLDVDSLRLFYLDEKAQQWIPVESKYDRKTMILTANIDHFSTYGEQANPIISGPGKILASQTNLHTGTAVFAYPIEIPSGRGGLQPNIGLTYDSGVADEMKNKRSVGSWVGIGWALDLGCINYDEKNETYSLQINGVSYELYHAYNINNSDGRYFTVPESFFTVTKSGSSWTIYDRDGSRYDFSHCRHYLSAEHGVINYRYDLTCIQDIHGNTINITYVEDLYGSDTRSAYPDHVIYNDDGAGHKVDIKFNSSWDFNDILQGGCLRNDNPKHLLVQPVDYNPVVVVENRKLDSIEVKLDSNLVRKYVFAYNTTPSYRSDEYGGIWYSGKFTLTSITEVGADAVSSLPATTFTYTDLPTRLHDTNPGPTHRDYTGNPGNPATFNWPHLTSINNGYGGNVTFSYTEKPSSTAENIWTREVVTGKTVNPGIGPVQTYTYTYTGDPQYLVHDANNIWDGLYRGFSQVRETDAAGYYVLHYYYTTGTMQNDYLTSREYKTEWYDSSAVLQKKVEYTWNYKYTGTAFGCTGERPNGPLLRYVAVDSAGNVYASDDSNNKIVKYNSFYYKIAEWGSSGTGPGQFYNPEGVAIDSDGHIWVADANNCRVQEFNSDGSFRQQWSTPAGPGCIAVDNYGYVYVDEFGYYVKKYSHSGVYQGLIADYGTGESQVSGVWDLGVDNNGYVYVFDQPSHYIKKYTTSGVYVSKHGGSGTADGQFYNPIGIWVDGYGNHWVVDQYWYGGSTNGGRVQKFNSNGDFQIAFGMVDYCVAWDVAVSAAGEVYFSGEESRLYAPPYYVYLSQVDTTIGTGGSAKTSRTRYLYDNYGNVITEYRDGDLSTSADDATVQRVFYPNTTANILSRPARERTYATITGDVGGANLKSETRYYYDGANNDGQWGTAPTKGDLTRLQQYKDASNWINTYYTYDGYGNLLTETDPNNNATTYTYTYPYFSLPTGKQYPTVGSLTMTESYTWDYGSGRITSDTDVNGNTTTYEYDTFKRIIKAIKPGDSSASPTIQYQYNNWGNVSSQNLKILTKLAEGNYTWQSQYFDGVGRVVQTQTRGETGYTVINSTTTYNSRGLVDREYVSQVLAGNLTAYYTPAGDWKYTTYAYDALGRVTTQTNADSTTIGHDYSTPWREQVTNQLGNKTNDYYDAFDRLIKVEVLNPSGSIYSTTTYSYDVLNNLKQVVDNSSNTITMNYDWLSRKTSMSDPDMGSWSYGYDNNSNLTTQTDAKSQPITFTYDALNRLTGKSGTGLSVGYTYDSTTGGNIGKGRRTSMNDASGNTTYKYDARGRLIQESHTIDSVNYTLQYGYDSADRLTTVTYPTGETVTQTYNGRGLAYSLSGNVTGNIVTSTLYNKLGQYTEMNLNNGIKTTFGYYGVGGSYDTTGGYYGRLWEIKSAVGSNVRQDVKYTWDAAGNLASRQDVKFGGTETFTTDFLDRLTAVSSAYSQSYSYNQIGNILSMNGSSYTYGSSRPHAVTQVGSTTYSYDANGNMITKGSTTTFGWNVENRLGNVTISGNTSTYVYDGDGNRIKKTEGGQTTIYIGKYYEKNTSTGTITTYYYLGDRLVALRNGTNLRYIHEDSLGSTSVVTDSSGAQYGYTRYYPFGATRDSSGSLDTSKKFTGQRLDGTGLYYYGARYYDPVIGRFISPDTVGPNPNNPQSLNKYSYCFNNPLVYIDPTGNWGFSNICKFFKDNVVAPIKETAVDVGKTVVSAANLIADPSLENAKEFGMNLGNVALGHGTVEGIASAIDTGDWKAATLGIVTGTVSLASNFVTPGGGKVLSGIISKTGANAAVAEVKGQVHHAISAKVYGALEKHPFLRGVYKNADDRFITQAKDAISHRGYQQWHRELDSEVSGWIERNQKATIAQFEDYLYNRYNESDLLTRFPSGLGGDLP